MAVPFLLCASFAVLGCGGIGPSTMRLTTENERTKAEIARLEAEISQGRHTMVTLDQEMSEIYSQLETEAAKRLTRAHLHIELPAREVLLGISYLLNGMEAVAPEFRFTLDEMDGRVHRGRLFLSSRYLLNAITGSCTGNVHGHLIHFDRNLLKMSDLDVICQAGEQTIRANLSDHLPLLPVPVWVLNHAHIINTPQISRMRETIQLVIPMSIRFRGDHLEVTSPVVTLERTGS